MRVVKTFSGELFAIPYPRMLESYGFVACFPAKRTPRGYEPKARAKAVTIQASQIVETVQS